MKHESIATHYENLNTENKHTYEKQRWERSPITRSHYRMTRRTLADILKKTHFTNCIELGPGPGTWTKVLIEKEPTASYTLVDISESMLSMARGNLESYEQKIEFVQSDFLKFMPQKKYDFFFSSRAVEYILDKKTALKKIYELLEEGSEAVITTKYPRYWAYRLLRREIPEMHRNQITPKKFKEICESVGFKVLSIKPVTVTVPFFKSAKLNDIAFKILRMAWVPCFQQIFTESYVIHLKK